MIRIGLSAMAVLASAALLAPAMARAAVTCIHTTDGTIEPGEWSCPTVSSAFFPLVSGTGGAWLYADQGAPGSSTLYLLYDYVSGGSLSANSYFDVFFAVPGDADYLVRISSSSLNAFEKPINTPAPEPGGTFAPGAAPWTPLTNSDLALANFQGALGFGSSPHDPADHPMAEFQLSINTSINPGSPNGIYDPSPAFWSASTNDPPISSAIFTLNPDGTTTVNPILGPNGGPVLQPLDATPEPVTGIMLAVGALALLLVKRRR
jgi:hypothetical protein